MVVNDGAERGKYYRLYIHEYSGIKLMQELIDRTQDKEDLLHLAQCVLHHRKAVGHTKKDYEKLGSI